MPDSAADKMIARTEGFIGHMIFNNPEKHNAVSFDMWDLADGILERFAADDAVRVLVLSGSGGKAFVSGADISKFDSERASAEATARYNERVKAVYERVENFPKPTIAMINGYCLGGGLNLAVACDIRFCSDKSQFGMPAARLALGYPFHAIRRLANVIGASRAKDLMFTARRVDADDALAMGLVQQVLPEADLAAFVAGYAESIGRNAPLTVRSMKFIAGEVMKDPAGRDLEKCDAMVAACFASEDYVEGRRAFMEKRKPAFKGR